MASPIWRVVAEPFQKGLAVIIAQPTHHVSNAVMIHFEELVFGHTVGEPPENESFAHGAEYRAAGEGGDNFGELVAVNLTSLG